MPALIEVQSNSAANYCRGCRSWGLHSTMRAPFIILATVLCVEMTLSFNPSGGIRPKGAPEELDCKMRELSLRYAQQLFPRRGAFTEVSDALQLDTLCKHTHETTVSQGHTPTPTHRAVGVPQGPISPSAVVADAATGSDKTGDGSYAKPYKTIGKAVSAAKGKPGTQVVLNGTFYVGDTVELTSEHSGLTITSLQGEEAVISGGVPLTLDWRRKSPKVNGAFVADLPASAPNFTSLFVDGRREIRARWPNGDPETTVLHTSPSGWVDQGKAKWASHSPTPSSKAETVTVKHVTRPGPQFGQFSMVFGGLTERYSPAMSKWGGTPRPTELTVSPKDLNNSFSYTTPETGIIHAFHGSHWGGWQFKMQSVSHNGSHTTIMLDPWGGQQEARGNTGGAEWYVENIVEELDAEREWFLDTASTPRQLHYFPVNGTSPPKVVIGSSLKRLMVLNGSQKSPVEGVKLLGLKFTQSAPTYLDKYEVPSGGDWSIHRGGAVLAQGVKDLVVDSCMFERLGGNALFLSNYAADTLIKDSEFAWIGDSAVAQVGSTFFAQTEKRGEDLMDGTNLDQPRGTVFTHNVVREIGVFGKQTSAFFQSVACNTTIENSVLFNGPRAGINFNDGFGGGNTIQNCLTFNWVRETSDHGNFNSWDRLPYLTETTGKKSTAVVESEIQHNLMWNNYHSTWPIDHDDGSCFFFDHNNFLMYGGAKNYLGHSKRNLANYYIYADLGASPVCMVDDSLNAQDTYANNTCIHQTGSIYMWQHYKGCGKGQDLNQTAEITYNNRFFSTDGKVHLKCGSETWNLAEYQAKGYDIGSTIEVLPEASEVVGWAAELFDIKSAPMQAAPKVKVLQFVMAKCPMTTTWHVRFAKQVMSQPGLRAIVDFDQSFVGGPVGEGPVNETNWRQCFHGPSECDGHKAMLCARNISDSRHNASSSPYAWYDMVTCMDGPLGLAGVTYNNSKAIPEDAQVCAQKVGLDWGPMQSCSQGPLGSQLLHDSHFRTMGLFQQHGGYKPAGHGYRPPLIPVVWIDGQQYNNPLSKPLNPYGDMVQRICTAYKGTPPKECSARY